MKRLLMLIVMLWVCMSVDAMVTAIRRDENDNMVSYSQDDYVARRHKNDNTYSARQDTMYGPLSFSASLAQRFFAELEAAYKKQEAAQPEIVIEPKPEEKKA